MVDGASSLHGQEMWMYGKVEARLILEEPWEFPIHVNSFAVMFEGDSETIYLIFVINMFHFRRVWFMFCDIQP